MKDIALKFDLLDKQSQGLVSDFIDMLLKRRQIEKTSSPAIINKAKKEENMNEEARNGSNIFDDNKLRKRLLQTSVWSDKEIAEMEENIESFKNWKLEE